VRNLGDKVHKVMRVSGVHQITEAIINKTGKDCGCNSRKKALNEAFPYNPHSFWLGQRFK